MHALLTFAQQSAGRKKKSRSPPTYSNNDAGTPLTQQPPHILTFLLLLPLLLQMAEILSLNPNMSLAQKRSFIRRFIKNSARPEPEYLKVLEMS